MTPTYDSSYGATSNCPDAEIAGAVKCDMSVTCFTDTD